MPSPQEDASKNAFDKAMLDAGPAPDALSRLLWRCAGADLGLLECCPNADRVKYHGLGGIVLATSVLAFFSSSYAFYTVFSPKEVAVFDRAVHWPTVVLAVVAGLVWALMIFNLDRFIVSSTGKGDGTEKITGREFFNAVPRMLMGGVIGVTLSVPLEIRILKTEIDAKLTHEVNAERDKLNDENRALFKDRRAKVRVDIEEAQKRHDERLSYYEKRRLEIKEQRRLLELEAEGKTASGVVGRGPAWTDKKDNLDKMEEEFKQEKTSDETKLENWQGDVAKWKLDLQTIDKEESVVQIQNERAAQRIDGLLRRIQIAEEIGGPVPWFLRLLLLALELSPIFFKLMMTKGVYDALVENRNLLIKARHGIETDAELFRGATNREEYRDVHHRVESVVAEERRRFESEQKLARKVHDEFVKEKAEEIEKDPKQFVSSD